MGLPKRKLAFVVCALVFYHYFVSGRASLDATALIPRITQAETTDGRTRTPVLSLDEAVAVARLNHLVGQYFRYIGEDCVLYGWAG